MISLMKTVCLHLNNVNSRAFCFNGYPTASRQSARNNRRYSPSPDNDAPSAKLRIENLHYDLTEDDLDGLFNRIGPVHELSLIYDRAGRSEGIAYVTYEYSHHAKRAIQEFDGANAKGQPIHLISIPSGPSGGRRNAAPGRSRSIFDRITVANRSPPSKSGYESSEMNSRTQRRHDRSISVNHTNSRGPKPHRRESRRTGERNNGGHRGERLARDNRPKKTQEELDAEMDEYWNSKDNNPANVAPAASTVAVDDEMRE
ncbi:putative rna binding protein [Golovinomyces cichoracearum]|uniref:Putative rna binding protein n=1 Tax=Golovinomyces cichoracearum TaxID=62708 RepID=A0A420HG83_9PEZI|nr:putative rna binding protein [Golovinomyces cichoracearum]